MPFFSQSGLFYGGCAFVSVAILGEEQGQESGTRDAESTEAFREWENLHPVILVDNSTCWL